MNDFDSVNPGMPFHFSFTQATPSCGATSSPLIVTSLMVQGVNWNGGSGSCATLSVTGQTASPEDANFHDAFSFDANVEGGNFPFTVTGGGVFSLVIPPGASYVSAAEFYVQPSSVPEPSTTSLLVLGFAGLAVMGRRRTPHTTMIQAG